MNELFEQAKSLYKTGDAKASEAAYRQLLEYEPDHYRAYCNLGCLLEDQGRLLDAQKCLMKAIEIKPDEPFLHYNVAHVLHQQERLESAVSAYEKALEFDPAMTAAHFNLGNCLDALGRQDEAARCFEQATRCDPTSVPAHAMLAEILKGLKRHDAAIKAYQQVLKLAPDDHSIAFQLGRLLELTQRIEEAEAAYRLVLQYNPLSALTRESLALILHNAGSTPAALELLQEGLTLTPGHPQLSHIHAALSGESVPDRASDAYVSSLFDQFSEDFEQVVDRLHYQGPQVVTKALAKVYPRATGELDILDIGCGTGLCGPLLKPYARQLIGVDLSTGMLGKARQREVYDELIAGEVTAKLQEMHNLLDVIIGADTLIYFGELEDILQACSTALRPDGVLIFTLESHAESIGANFTLHPHGRYSHTRSYLHDALATANLNSLRIEDCFLRTQNNLPVAGFICTACPATAPKS